MEKIQPFERDEVIRILSQNEYTKVVFYKVNGDLREMVCTLNHDELYKLSQEEDLKNILSFSESETNFDPNQIRVFDVEKRGWRSFLLSDLITIEGINI